MGLYITSLVAVIAIAGFAYWRMQVAFDRVSAAYERMLDRRDREYDELASRLFYTKNLPPAGVAMDEEYKERQELRRQHEQNREKRPHRIGTLDSALLAAEIEDARRVHGHSN